MLLNKLAYELQSTKLFCSKLGQLIKFVCPFFDSSISLIIIIYILILSIRYPFDTRRDVKLKLNQ